MARVVAIAPGHDGVYRREVGEEFDLDLDDPRFKTSTWFVPANKAPAPKRIDPNAPPPGAGPRKGSRVKPEHGGDDLA